MFELSAAIMAWRRSMEAGGVRGGEVLDELESHLRDEMEARMRRGEECQNAFAAAARGMGGASELKREFDKIGGQAAWRSVRRALLILAGIPDNPHNHGAAAMTIASPEPRWATYVKAAAFVLPAMLVWIFGAIFVMPKLQQICNIANMQLFGALRALNHVGEYAVPICLAIAALLIGLEWRSTKWPAYRRAALGVGVFLVNSMILVCTAMMVIAALMAAPALMQAAGK